MCEVAVINIDCFWIPDDNFEIILTVLVAERRKGLLCVALLLLIQTKNRSASVKGFVVSGNF